MGFSKRQPKEIWQQTRQRIWQREKGRCQGPYCKEFPEWALPLEKAHIDHIVELSRGGSNADSNLRVLCRRCHVLRANKSHQGMISAALRDGIIPPNWRELVWEG
jgi:5-methylcytosine-specific restriction endonuclease McrA